MRITLAAKLRKTGEFEDVAKLVKSVSKPVKLIQDKFQVTYITAKKFVDEVQGFTPLTKKEAVTDNQNINIANLFIRDLDDSVRIEPTWSTLKRFGDRLEKYNINVLIELYKLLSDNTPATYVAKHQFILAIKYIVQKRHYPKVYGCDMSTRLEDKTQEYIAECQK
jgi:hypothetical protein